MTSESVLFAERLVQSLPFPCRAGKDPGLNVWIDRVHANNIELNGLLVQDVLIIRSKRR